MNKALRILSFLLLAGVAHAQYKPGISAGGSASVGTTSFLGTTFFQTAVSPEVRYAYRPEYMIGLSTGFAYYEESYRALSLLPYWRINRSVSEIFGVYGRFGPNLSITSLLTSDYLQWDVGATGNFGLFFLPWKSVSIEANLAGLGYSYGRSRSSGTDASRNTFSASVTNNLSLSLYYHF